MIWLLHFIFLVTVFLKVSLLKDLLIFTLLLTVLGLHCCGLSSCGEQGRPFVAVLGLLIETASLVTVQALDKGSITAAHRLESTAQGLWCMGFSLSTACGIFPRLGIELMSLALVGRFLATGPLGRPYIFYLILNCKNFPL